LYLEPVQAGEHRPVEEVLLVVEEDLALSWKPRLEHPALAQAAFPSKGLARLVEQTVEHGVAFAG
jgi:hypothetical protein